MEPQSETPAQGTGVTTESVTPTTRANSKPTCVGCAGPAETTTPTGHPACRQCITTERHGTEIDTKVQLGSVEYAVRTLGEVINVAFSDALRLDHLSRLTLKAFGNIGFLDRIALGDQYPRLVEALIMLETAINRIDDR